MVSPTISPELQALAMDFNKPNTYPRSPREMLAGYVIAARILDKCRAILNGTGEEYKYNCPLDRFFFDFTGIDADAFQSYAATGASDEDVAQWIQARSNIKEKIDIVKWNNEMRFKTVDKLSDYLQLFLEEVLFEKLPMIRLIYFFDLIDMEEDRIPTGLPERDNGEVGCCSISR